MDDTTRIALLDSIQHWEDNASAKTFDTVAVSSNACGLCRQFMKHDCYGCPVRERTGRADCSKSPYWDAFEAFKARNLESFHAAAHTEVAFLRSLLPADDQKTEG